MLPGDDPGYASLPEPMDAEAEDVTQDVVSLGDPTEDIIGGRSERGRVCC